MPFEENSTEQPETKTTEPTTQTETKSESEKTEAPKAPDGEAPLLTSQAAEAPEPFDVKSLKIPEGVEVPEEILSAFGEVATKRGLRGEAAQDVFDLGQKVAAQVHEANVKAWAETQKKWRDEISADKDFGGEKLKPTLAKVSKLLDRFADPGWRDVLNQTYMGNNPFLIRTLARMADAFTEPGHVAGKPAASAQPSIASTFFPSMTKE